VEKIIGEFGFTAITSVLVIVLLIWILTHTHSLMEFVFLGAMLGGVVYFSMELSRQMDRNNLFRDYLMISKRTAIKNYIGRHNPRTGQFRVIGRYRSLISNLKEVEEKKNK
jgi:hypothetical protein